MANIIKIGDPSCSVFSRPTYEDDPGGYWDWWDRCLVVPDEIFEPPPWPPWPCRPRRWEDSQGRCWRIVCTDLGEEIRPCFEFPDEVLAITPRIDSIQITANGFLVRVVTERGSSVERVEPGHGRLKGMASAMLGVAKLPADNLADISDDFWYEQPPVEIDPSLRKA